MKPNVPTYVKRKGTHFRGPINVSGSEIYDVEDFTITSAQILANFTTEITILPACDADRAIVVLGVYLYKPAGTAYTLNSNTQLQFRYTNKSGTIVAASTSTGFIDQATAQIRYVFPSGGTTASIEITPVANTPIVVFANVANPTLGTSAIFGKIFFKTVPATMPYVGYSSYTQTP